MINVSYEYAINPTDGEITIDTTNFPWGDYVVSLIMNGTIVDNSKKLIKKENLYYTIMKLNLQHFMLASAIAVSTIYVACSTDNADEPQISNPTEGSTNPNDDGIDELDPEPLTEYLRPIYTDGKRWEYQNYYTDREPGPMFNIYVDGDTTVLGENARIVKTDGPLHLYAYGLIGIIKEEDGRVYRLWADYGKDPIRDIDIFQGYSFKLNFDINIAKSSYTPTYAGITVPESRGVIKLQGKLRRAVKVAVYEQYHPNYPNDWIILWYDYWVEGIGSLFSAIPWYHSGTVPGTLDRTPSKTTLIKCYDGDELIYDASKFSESLYTELERFTDIDLQSAN